MVNRESSDTKTKNASRTLYLFIDESGNFDFSPKGTKYFTLTGFVTFQPVTKRDRLLQLRYRLLSDGYNIEQFHATEDKQAVRDEVYDFLADLGNSYEVHSVIAQKNKVNPSLYKETYQKKGKTITRNTGMGLYKKLCETLLKYIFRGKDGAVDTIIIVLGSIYTGEKRKVLLQTLKHFLKENFPHIPFEIYMHQTCADLNCQLADYCCWAIYVNAEREESRPYKMIEPQIKSIFDIFESGTTIYYEYDR